jgi:hypothetical protein
MVHVLQYSKVCALTDDNRAATLCSVSVVYIVVQQRETQSLLVMRQLSVCSHTPASDQPCSENTPAHPGHYLLAKCWAVSSGNRMYCQRTSWSTDVQLTPSSTPHWTVCNRPLGECLSLLSDGVILLRDNAWPHAAQRTWNLLQNFGSEMLDHTVQIWHPSVSDISHLERALSTKLFHDRWRHQAC